MPQAPIFQGYLFAPFKKMRFRYLLLMKLNHVPCSLTVANDFSYLPIVLNFVKGIAQLAGFAENDQQRIELAVEEAVSNVIKHAFKPGEKASYDVQCALQPKGLSIAIFNQGLPFDPKRLADFNPEADVIKNEVRGLGRFFIKSLMDKVEYKNLGKKGKELRLVKYYPQ